MAFGGGYATKPDRERLGMDGPLTPHALGHYFSDHLMKHGCDGNWWNLLRGDIPHSNAKTYVHPTAWVPLVVSASLIGLAAAGMTFRPPIWFVALALSLQRHGYVESKTPRFFSDAARRPKAAMMHSVALLGQGKFREAATFALGLYPEDRPDAASFHYLTAWALGGCGEFEQSREHLDACLTMAPQYAEEVRRNRVLMHVLALGESDLRGEGYA